MPVTQRSEPSVSVCIPVYNGAAFIAEAVKSVLAQTFADFELIVLDNASTDATPHILGQFTDMRLRIVHHASNIGAIANWNAALREARGEWVKILCADDLLYPNCLEQQMLNAAPSCGEHPVLLCSAFDIIDAPGRRWMRCGFSGRSGPTSAFGAIRRSIRAGTNLFGPPAAVLMRRESALQAGGFDPAWVYCLDIDLWVRILQQGDLYVSSTALCAFRISALSLSIPQIRTGATDFYDWMLQRQQDGLLRVRCFEMLMGRLMAHLRMAQRRIFYGILKRQKRF